MHGGGIGYKNSDVEAERHAALEAFRKPEDMTEYSRKVRVMLFNGEL